MQWHPIFARLLRSMLEAHYDIQTEVSVGDLPRQADIVLVRRTAKRPRYRGVWRHLTMWNVLEFKGPTDTPGLRDLDLLAEVALGIERRLDEDRGRQGRAKLPRREVSWWYSANHLGKRFLAEAADLLGRRLQPRGQGLWRCRGLGRVVFLMSRDRLPVERESIPLHLVTAESAARQQALAREVVSDPLSWQRYGNWLAFLHPAAEVQRMIRDITREENLDLRPIIELVGLQQVIDQVGLERVIDQVGLERVIDQVGLERVIDQVGLKRVIAEVGPKKVLAELGPEQILAEMDWILKLLTPEQREELKSRLQ